jgi:hypothetical protein
VVLSTPDVGAAKGFYVFAILNALTYASALFVIIIAHLRENGLLRRPRLSRMFLQPMIPTVLVMLAVGAANLRALTGLEALQWGAYRVGLVEVTYGVVGAGHDRADSRKVWFAPRFLNSDEDVE